MDGEPLYVLHATAIVGCSISLFFCILSLIALFCFRPSTESLAVKKHMTIAVCGTQLVLLFGIVGYRDKNGCRALSVLLHFTATACFTWCAIDALSLYFFHVNSFHPIKNIKFYLLMGWGIPAIVLVMSAVVGFFGLKSRPRLSALYTCWSSDHVIWTFVVPSILVAAVNIVILSIILKQLRQPSYDVCPKSVMEKRGTRYGLRTNSLMLLGLCLGWIFAMLSFRDVENVRYQLTFGLVNGLQGIFLFFFHCVLNTDHVKNNGCSTASQRGKHESGRGMSDTHSKRLETQSGSLCKTGGRPPPKENVPLISVVNGSSKQGEVSSTTASENKDKEENTLTMNVVSNPLQETLKPRAVEQLRKLPDHDVIPRLPGTPEPNPKVDQRMSLPLELTAKKSPSGAATNSPSRTSAGREEETTTNPTHKMANQLQVVRSYGNNERRRKASSDPAIPSTEIRKQAEPPGRNTNHSDSTSRLSAYSVDHRPRKTSQPHGSSLNELERLFSSPDFVKPHRSSVSSLQGPRGPVSQERRVPHESSDRLRKGSSIDLRDVDRKGEHPEAYRESLSRSHSRNTEETTL